MAETKDTKDAKSADEGPKQTVVRMPADIDAGPHFPSGMSAPEAAMAGATEGLSDEDVAVVEEMRTEYGVEPA